MSDGKAFTMQVGNSQPDLDKTDHIDLYVIWSKKKKLQFFLTKLLSMH